MGAQPGVAERALEHLKDAEGLAADPRLRARALQHQGLIHERFLKDPSGAREKYRQASAADPSNKRAKTALARLEKAEAEMQRKLKHGGN